jgi:hypothetical protein
MYQALEPTQDPSWILRYDGYNVLDESHQALEPTQDPSWILRYDGYNVLDESALESRFAFGNGFLGMRAARSVSRGPTWVSWLGYSRWGSWPRCYVAGLFDVPNTEPPVPALVPVADWSRVRIVLDGEPLLACEGEVLHGTRTLDMRRGMLLSAWTHRTPAGITATGHELRLLSLADRAAGLQLLRLTLDRDGVGVRLDASFAMAGLGMEPTRLEPDVGAWRTEGTGKGVAMAGAARLRLDGNEANPDRPFSLRWTWRWRSVAGQVAELDRVVVVARADTCDDDPMPAASAALARNRALGWRAVLAAHETAWDARWKVGEIRIEGDEESQRALRFAVYHLSSAANPEDDRVSIGARALTGDAYLGHVFWDTEIYLLPFYTAVWPEAARALLMYRFHTLPGARAKAAHFGFKGALYAWESADTGMETTPERVVVSDGTMVEILTGRMEHHISADVAYAVWQYCAPPATTISSFAPAPRSCWKRRGSGRPGLCWRRMGSGTFATSSGRTSTTTTLTTMPLPTSWRAGTSPGRSRPWTSCTRAGPTRLRHFARSWCLAMRSLRAGATRSHASSLACNPPRASMSSSPASTRSSRSTSLGTPTAPCQSMS